MKNDTSDMYTARGLYILCCLMGHLLAEAPDSQFPGMAGPLPLRILGPVHGLFYQLPPERAAALPRGTWQVEFQLSETNTLLPPEGTRVTEFQPDFDAEMTRLNFVLRRGLPNGWEIRTEIPLIYFHNGFLDGIIHDAEVFFGRLSQRRKHENRGEFDYALLHNQQTFLEGRNGYLGFGDLAFAVKKTVARQNGFIPCTALRFGLKAPTGNVERGLGSGRADVALGGAIEYDFRRFSVSANIGATFPIGNHFEQFGLETRAIASGHAEIEYRITRRTSLHLQLAGTSAPFDLDPDRSVSPFPVKTSRNLALTGGIIQVTPGIAWRPRPSITLFAGVAEDFQETERAASDLTIFVSLAYRFGKK